jgi:hypothetical protein
MPSIVMIHDVRGLDTWVKYNAERAEAIGAIGGSNIVDHVAEDGSTTVALTIDVDDVEAVLAQVASPSPELLQAMQRHGVVPPLKIFVER